MLTEHRTSSVKRLTGRLYQSLVAVVVYILCFFLLELSVNELINIFVFLTLTLFLLYFGDPGFESRCFTYFGHAIIIFI